jgi:hypothetical protein
MNDYPTFLLTDADGLASNRSPALVVLQVTRREIETGYIASVTERLQILVDSPANVRLYRECLLLEVTGYDNDPRELVEIDEVRRYFKRLAQEWPFWLWFLMRSVGAIPLLVALLCRVTVIRRPGACGTAFESVAEVRAVLSDLTRRTNSLANYGVAGDDLVASTRSAVDEVIGIGS